MQLSGLAAPGIGHLHLKQRGFGIALTITALAAPAPAANPVMQQAQTIADRIIDGAPLFDPRAIARAVSESSQAAGGAVANAEVIVLGSMPAARHHRLAQASERRASRAESIAPVVRRRAYSDTVRR